MRELRRLAVAGLLAVSLAALGAGPALAASPSSTNGAMQGTPNNTGLMKSVSGWVRCVCGTCTLTVANCTCDTANSMRAEVQKLIDRGDGETQILAAMQAKYGQDVLAAPPRQGFFLTAWLLPVAAILGGLAALTAAVQFWVRERRRPALAVAGAATTDADPAASGPLPPAPASDDALRQRLDRELAQFEH